jgi:hypothetical protein
MSTGRKLKLKYLCIKKCAMAPKKAVTAVLHFRPRARLILNPKKLPF